MPVRILALLCLYLVYICFMKLSLDEDMKHVSRVKGKVKTYEAPKMT